MQISCSEGRLVDNGNVTVIAFCSNNPAEARLQTSNLMARLKAELEASCSHRMAPGAKGSKQGMFPSFPS